MDNWEISFFVYKGEWQGSFINYRLITAVKVKPAVRITEFSMEDYLYRCMDTYNNNNNNRITEFNSSLKT